MKGGRMHMVKIESVRINSKSYKAGICDGDILLSINGNEINDVLDYRFYLTDKLVILRLIRGSKESRDSINENKTGEEYEVVIHKQQYDDIGLEFETPLMDKKHSCRNKCIFCFIDQLPQGMRETLYFKDDDSRLSFIHGNYITMTNLYEKDIDRIIKMHISPINISVHTTNPDLRVKMMQNKRAGEVLKYMDKLSKAGITICAQIVLCKNINDCDELERSMNDLIKLMPSLSSVSIVPAGLTRYRDKLYELKQYTKEEAADIIAQVDRFANICKEKFGTRLFFCADELYIEAQMDIPDEEYYEGYPQIENGVGMIRSMREEFDCELKYIEELAKDAKFPKTVSIATGVAAYEDICRMTQKLEAALPGLKINVYKVINHFFGESITVAGLLTGKDISEQLREKDLGSLLLFPENALRDGGDMFLDNMTPDELSQRLGVSVIPSPNDGAKFIETLIKN